MDSYYIEWIDIRGTSQSWTSLEEVGNEKECLVKQVGYMVKKTDEYIWITDSWVESMELVGNITKIPRVVVKKMKKLK